MTLHAFRTLLMPLAAVLVASCAQVEGPATARIAAEETPIFFPAPALLGAEQTFVRYEDNEQRTDYARYEGPDARAEALLLRANIQSDLILSSSDLVQATPAAVQAWRRHAATTVVVGEPRIVRARGRTYRALPFATPEDGACFLFSARGDRQNDDRRRRPKLALVGYYCEPLGAPFDDRRIEAVLGELRVDTRGYVRRSIPAEDERLLPAETGHSAFPLQIARHFSPQDGSSDSL